VVALGIVCAGCRVSASCRLACAEMMAGVKLVCGGMFDSVACDLVACDLVACACCFVACVHHNVVVVYVCKYAYAVSVVRPPAACRLCASVLLPCAPLGSCSRRLAGALWRGGGALWLLAAALACALPSASVFCVLCVCVYVCVYMCKIERAQKIENVLKFCIRAYIIRDVLDARCACVGPWSRAGALLILIVYVSVGSVVDLCLCCCAGVVCLRAGAARDTQP
jgi:hypothetical protein